MRLYKPVSAPLALASARSEIERYANDREADADDVVTLAALRLIFGQAKEHAPQDADDGRLHREKRRNGGCQTKSQDGALKLPRLGR